MNRGSERIQCLVRDLPAASMRPRFMNRGSAFSPDRWGRSRRRFNEAPIHESGK